LPCRLVAGAPPHPGEPLAADFPVTCDTFRRSLRFTGISHTPAAGAVPVRSGTAPARRPSRGRVTCR